MAAASTLIPVSDYLRTTYEPDAEYVDGVIEERPMGEYSHSSWQGALFLYFNGHAVEWQIRIRTELRVQAARTRYRVPDAVVFDRNAPTEQILTHPPYIVFEILSPEDLVSRILVKLKDYEVMGIPGIFVINPGTDTIYRYVNGSLDVLNEEITELELPKHGCIDWKIVRSLLDS